MSGKEDVDYAVLIALAAPSALLLAVTIWDRISQSDKGDRWFLVGALVNLLASLPLSVREGHVGVISSCFASAFWAYAYLQGLPKWLHESLRLLLGILSTSIIVLTIFHVSKILSFASSLGVALLTADIVEYGVDVINGKAWPIGLFLLIAAGSSMLLNDFLSAFALLLCGAAICVFGKSTSGRKENCGQ